MAPGPIRLEDLYHYLPVGAHVGVGEVRGAQLAGLLENSADGALNPDPWVWKGGWLHATAGLRYDLDPAAGRGARTSEVTVLRAGAAEPEPLDPDARYTVAGYHYEATAGKVGPLDAETVRVLTGHDGEPLDATEVVARHLAGAPVTAVEPSIRLTGPLPGPVHANPELQPLRGVPTAPAPGGGAAADGR